jgi:hypothetical protein
VGTSFVSKGYIEVWRGETLISRHREDKEAFEVCSNADDGEYEIRYPIVRVTVNNKTTEVGAISWSAMA